MMITLLKFADNCLPFIELEKQPKQNELYAKIVRIFVRLINQVNNKNSSQEILLIKIR